MTNDPASIQRLEQAYESRCPSCNRFLTKSRLKIEVRGLSDDEFDSLMTGTRIFYGGSTKCRNCRRIQLITREYKKEKI